jgi:hypothetical protein
VHRGTKNSFPRAGGFKRFKRAFLGDGAREAGSILHEGGPVFSDLGEGDFAAKALRAK